MNPRAERQAHASAGGARAGRPGPSARGHNATGAPLPHRYAQTRRGVRHRMHCGHSPFFAHPQELVALLSRLGAEPGASSSRAQAHGRFD